MKTLHALTEKAICGIVGLFFAAFFIFGITRLQGLVEPADLQTILESAGDVALPEVKPVNERKIRGELEQGSRPLVEYASIIDRNPFVRFEPRHVVSDSALAQKEEEKESTYIYRGMASVGNVMRAILEERESNEIFFVGSGSKLGSFKVLDITQDAVVLSKEDGQESVIKLTE